MSYTRGLHEIGDGLYAYLQPDGGWGLSNAGLVVSGEGALLIDTLFDLPLTQAMLDAMDPILPAAGIQTLVNTHANGDHTFGNRLVGGARVVASRQTAEEMPALPPQALAAMVEQAAQLGDLGRFISDAFGAFEFAGNELRLPDETFEDELTLNVGDREARLTRVGPAHTQGDTIVHLPAQRVLFTGDILFAGRHPLMWVGPVSNWIAACDHILTLDLEAIVPGHGPLADQAAVRETRDYFLYVEEEARARHGSGMTPVQAAAEMADDRWAQWPEAERLAANVAAIFAEIEGREPEPLAQLQVMAERATQLRV